jgi:hypothetical protein
MKKITSILSSVLLVSFTLVPTAAVLAEESTSTATTTPEVTVTATTTTVVTPVATSATNTRDVREGLKNFIDQKKVELKNFQNNIKTQIKDKKVEVKDMRNATGTRPDWKNGTSTASTTRAVLMQARKDAQIKKNIDTITQNLTTVANKLGALGTQIKAIVSGQASSSDAVSAAVGKEDNRGFWGKFIFGADPKNLGVIISQVSIMQARVNQLNNQISKLATSTDKTTLVTNVQSLKDQIATLEQYVKDNINSFSLFGWLNNYKK